MGRTVRWTLSGLEWEGDQKVIQSLLEGDQMDESRPVDTPGVKIEEPVDGPVLMDFQSASKYRRGAAHVDYIAQDRAYLGYASKEVSRPMG